MTDEASWAKYVACWPAWRDPKECTGVCLYALVCGRARVCLQAHVRERALVYALARLSARVGERAPARYFERPAGLDSTNRLE